MGTFWRRQACVFKRLWLGFEYQLATKLLWALALFPLYRLGMWLLVENRGRTAVSSGDFLPFFLSLRGIAAAALSLLALALMLACDMNALVLLNYRLQTEGGRPRVRHMLRGALESLKGLASLPGAAVVLWSAAAMSFVGTGAALAPVNRLRIPRFVAEHIMRSPLYCAAYFLLAALFVFFSFRYAFVFHFMVIKNMRPGEAMRASARLTGNRLLRFARDLFLPLLGWSAAGVAVWALMHMGMIRAGIASHAGAPEKRFLMLFLAMLIVWSTAALSLLSLPALTGRLTTLFIRYTGGEAHPAAPVEIRRRRLLILPAALAAAVVAAGFVTAEFDTLFTLPTSKRLAAHRGGGNLDAENTLEGILKAIELGADDSEIDIQRTKDGRYVLNHDATFVRLTGDRRRAKDMTAAEATRLMVRNHFKRGAPARPVPLLDTVLDAAKGRIRLLIELKGETADRRMADDVVRMLRLRGMQGEAVLISLDHGLIKYIDAAYPDIRTGYLYFFLFGSSGRLAGDILLMEEGAAAGDGILRAHLAGRQAYVWTVNRRDAMRRVLLSEADGIITDDLPSLLAAREACAGRDDLDRVMEEILGW